MEDQTWSFGLSNASRSHRSKLKSHFGDSVVSIIISVLSNHFIHFYAMHRLKWAFMCLSFYFLDSEAELCIDFEEMDGDDELKTAYPCPFCAEDFDLLELWCHIDDYHSIEAKTGICPVCTTWVGMNMVEHFTAQHGNVLRSQHKSGYCKLESYPTLSLSRKDLQDGDGHWQSFSTGSSPEISSSKIARDPLLSFLYISAAADERENVQPHSSSEVRTEEIHSKESVLARDVQQSLFDKEHIGKAQRSEFVQGLVMSTILDPDF